MNKKYNLKLDLQFRCNNSTMKFNQFDNNTSDFFIRITNGGKLFDIEKAIVVLATIKPSGKVASQFVEIENGLVYADLKPNMKDEIGTYTAKAMLILEDERVVTDAISYEVEEDKIFSLLNDTVETTEEFTLLTDMLSRLSNIETNEEQRMINEAERILSEENRKIEEAKRVEAELIRQHEEADRTKYEAIRESNENIRKQNESIRLANETNRIDEEAKRVEEEDKRKLAEEERNANYNFMTEDEERRRSEANAHKEAENLRVQAETNRVNEEAKRRTTEQARVSAENTRVSNENTRKANETTRQSNEAKRVEAETQRQSRYNSFIADAEANANNFENYTNTAKVKEEERKSNELDRKSQEARRVSNEVERISNENTRKANEVAREKNEASRQDVFENKVSEVDKKIVELNTTKDNFISSVNAKVDNKISELDNAKSDMTNTVLNKVNEVETRFNTLTSSQQQDAEVIDARDGEASLKARLDRDLYKDGISLSDRIEAIEGLKDSQNMKYETDKGYLVCKETKNGVIDDLKIEGKTLVNLFNNSTVKLQEAQNRLQCDNNENRGLYKKGVYTIVNLCDKTVTPNIYKTNPNTWIKLFNVPGKSSITINLEENQSICEVVWPYSFGWTSSDLDKVRNGLVILEGDHTQNPPSYFEGLMSVGEDVDKIEVLSVKNDGNLFDGTLSSWWIGSSVIKEESSKKYSTLSMISPNEVYTIKNHTREFNRAIYAWLDKDFNTISVHTFTSINECTTNISPNNSKYLLCYVNSIGDLSNNDNIILNKGTTPKPYTPYQSDKKQILFYNENGELEPVTELHKWDSIEKHSDNKWYYHKRSGKVVLNGSENWNNDTNSSTISPATYRQSIRFDAINMPNSAFNTQTLPNIISNSLPTVIFGDVYNYNHIGISISGTDSIGTHIIINNNFMNVTELKQWLQANNLTLLYPLAEEEVYEIAPLHLDSYANETLILCNSGAISPKMEFSITSHINELVKAYGERINLLEEKVYKYMVTQNRMQLASTYSADSVTFKVDYFSLCGDEENYDEDLYNLILNNILVGKDNYNYDKMFTIILDYASWNQISWEQFDILVGLMDMQHNPPVEELPTEDGIEEDIIENEETPVE